MHQLPFATPSNTTSASGYRTSSTVPPPLIFGQPATCWRHGRQATHIPPLSINNTLSGDPQEMAQAFQSRFFTTAPSHIPVSQLDDPPPIPLRVLTPVLDDEVALALKGTSNASAPGLSGINYKVIKWAFCANPSRFSTLYMTCLTLGFHPWHEANIVIIPKPNKPDYSAPKAYRPISLLECIGKLLEKIVATHFLSNVNVFSLIPTNQFGSRDYSSAVDAAMAIAHNAESCLQSGTISAMVLFNIQGFFNNISIPHLICLCTDLGFPVAMCNWLSSFLHDRLVHLSFNGFSSNPITLDHGIPQGSPLSPILSAIFTSPLLKLINSSWQLWTLAMFVDDGSIFATSSTFREASRLALSGFEQVLGWLHRNGLRADQEKTEFITFGHKHTHIGSPPDQVAIRDPTQGEYNVTHSTQVHYLGVFFHE